MTRACLDCSGRPQETKDGLCGPCQAARWEAYHAWRRSRTASPEPTQSTLGGWA